MNVFNIARAFSDKKIKGWEKLYFCIDLHDVVISATYNKFNEGAKIAPYAVDFFRWAKTRKDICTILWTSSYESAITQVRQRLSAAGIEFDYVDENPECPSNALCDFDKKFYFNVLLDDKAGFEAETDWLLIINELKRIGEWNYE
jgi:hypothetical protein